MRAKLPYSLHKGTTSLSHYFHFAKDFANKVLMLAKDEARYRLYSKNAVQAIEQELNWDVFCKELINIYNVETDRSEQQLS